MESGDGRSSRSFTFLLPWPKEHGWRRRTELLDAQTLTFFKLKDFISNHTHTFRFQPQNRNVTPLPNGKRSVNWKHRHIPTQNVNTSKLTGGCGQSRNDWNTMLRLPDSVVTKHQQCLARQSFKWCLFILFYFVFETGSHVVQSSLKLTMWVSTIHLHFLSAGMKALTEVIRELLRQLRCGFYHPKEKLNSSKLILASIQCKEVTWSKVWCGLRRWLRGWECLLRSKAMWIWTLSPHVKSWKWLYILLHRDRRVLPQENEIVEDICSLASTC